MEIKLIFLFAFFMVLIAPSISNPQNGHQHESMVDQLEKFLTGTMESVERHRRADDDYDDEEDEEVKPVKRMKEQSIFLRRGNVLLSSSDIHTSNWGRIRMETGKLQDHYAFSCTVISNIKNPAMAIAAVQGYLNNHNRQ